MRGLIVGAVIGLAAGLLIQGLRYSNLRKTNQQLERNVTKLQQEIAGREPAVPTAAGQHSEERIELLRLRNQAAQLRALTNELQRLRAQANQSQASAQPVEAVKTASTTAAAELVSREAWSFAGYATPEAAFQSTIFAHSQGDYNTFLASLTGDLARDNKEVLERKTPEEFAEYLRQETAKITSYRILEREEISPEETVLVIYEAGISDMERVLMRKVGNEWKLAGPAPDKTKRQ